MIDQIVVLNAVVAGLLLYRASQETFAWDRSGFALLACAAGLLTLRRVTMPFDRFEPEYLALLPHMIAWVMLAASTCFVVDLMKRKLHTRTLKEGVRVGAGKFFWPLSLMLFFWPLSLMLLASAGEFIPTAGPTPREHTAEETLRIALRGQNPSETAASVAQHAARSIDVLRVMLTAEDGADVALEQLKSLVARASDSIAARESVPTK